MKKTKKYFDINMFGNPNADELKRLIELAEIEIREWKSFLKDCKIRRKRIKK